MSMFSFFNKKEVEKESTASPAPEEPEPPAVEEERPSEGASSTGFSFLNRPPLYSERSDPSEATEKETNTSIESGVSGVSGFGFLGGTSASDAEEVSTQEEEPASLSTMTSSFSFMGTGSTEEAVLPANSNNASRNHITADSTVSSSIGTPSHVSSNSPELTAKNKNQKVPVPGIVKPVRKKRASTAKVGYGRKGKTQTDEAEEVDESAPVSMNVTPIKEEEDEPIKPSTADTSTRSRSATAITDMGEHGVDCVDLTADADAEDAPATHSKPTLMDEINAYSSSNSLAALGDNSQDLEIQETNVSHYMPKEHVDDKVAVTSMNADSDAIRRTSLSQKQHLHETLVTSTMSPLELLEYDTKHILSDYIVVAQDTYKEHENSIALRREAQEKTEALHKQIQDYSEQLQEAEKKLEAYAENEEFDKADVMASVIDDLKAEKDAHCVALEELKSKSNHFNNSGLDSNSGLVASALKITDIEKQTNILQGTILNKLESVKENKKNKLELMINESKTKQTRELHRLDMEENRLQVQKDHADKEESVIDQEIEITEKSIREQTDEEQETQKSLTLRIVDVGSEIMALERQLAEKRQEEKKLRSNLEDVEARIVSIRKKFDRQLGRINDKKDALMTLRSELQQEEMNLDVERGAYSRDFDETNKLQAGLDTWVADVDNNTKITSLMLSALSFLKECSDADANLNSKAAALLPTEAQGETSHRLDLQTSFNESQAYYQSLSQELHDGHSKLLEYQSEWADIEDQLPKLEIEKKSHAAARKFKEAGVVSKEIKSLIARKEILGVDINSLTEELQQKENEVNQVKVATEEIKQQLNDLDRDLDKTLLDTYRKRSLILNQRYLSPLQDAHEYHISGEFKTMKSFRDTAVMMLTMEVSVLDANIEYLRQKHASSPLKETEFDMNDIMGVTPEDPQPQEEDGEAVVVDPVDLGEDEEMDCGDGSVENNNVDAETPLGDVEGCDGGESVGEVEDEGASEPTDEVGPDEEPESQLAVNVEAMKAEALELHADVTRLEQDIEAASEEEQYDLAAELSEKLEKMTASLNHILSELHVESVADLE